MRTASCMRLLFAAILTVTIATQHHALRSHATPLLQQEAIHHHALRSRSMSDKQDSIRVPLPAAPKRRSLVEGEDDDGLWRSKKPPSSSTDNSPPCGNGTGRNRKLCEQGDDDDDNPTGSLIPGGEAPTGDPVTDDAVTGDPVTDDAVTGDPVTDDAVTDDAVTDDNNTDDTPSNEGEAINDPGEVAPSNDADDDGLTMTNETLPLAFIDTLTLAHATIEPDPTKERYVPSNDP